MCLIPWSGCKGCFPPGWVTAPQCSSFSPLHERHNASVLTSDQSTSCYSTCFTDHRWRVWSILTSYVKGTAWKWTWWLVGSNTFWAHIVHSLLSSTHLMCLTVATEFPDRLRSIYFTILLPRLQTCLKWRQGSYGCHLSTQGLRPLGVQSSNQAAISQWPNILKISLLPM